MTNTKTALIYLSYLEFYFIEKCDLKKIRGRQRINLDQCTKRYFLETYWNQNTPRACYCVRLNDSFWKPLRICWKGTLGENVSISEISRSSHPEVFCKKGILRNFSKLTGKHFFNKVTGVTIDGVAAIIMRLSSILIFCINIWQSQIAAFPAQCGPLTLIRLDFLRVVF